MGESRHHPPAPRRHRPCRGRAGRERPPRQRRPWHSGILSYKRRM